MNRMQKISWMMVITIGTAVIASATAVTILYFRFGFPKAWAGLVFLSIAGLAALAPVVFRKERGAVQMDERDRLIQLHASRAGFASCYVVFGLLSMGIYFYTSADKMVHRSILPIIWIMAFTTTFFIKALTILILYGRDTQPHKGGTA